MQEARANILRLGGIPRLNTFSKLYLALLGQFPWNYLPTIPVEMILLPDLGAVSHLQDVLLEPGHARAAGDHQSFQTDAAFAWPQSICTSFIRSAPSTKISPCHAMRAFLLGEIFSCEPTMSSSLSAVCWYAHCAGSRWKKPNAGWSSGSAREATGWPPFFRRCSIRLIALRALGYAEEPSAV